MADLNALIIFAKVVEAKSFSEASRRLKMPISTVSRRSAEISGAIDNVVSYQLSYVSGKLRLSAPPSISDSLLAPLVGAFQATYPEVRVDIFVTNRFVDFIDEGIDLAIRLGTLKDSSLVAQKILTYRHRLVASPAYLERFKPPETPQELLGHR